LRYAAKVLVKYHLMEEVSQPWTDLQAWASATPFVTALWRQSSPELMPVDWLDGIVADLCASGAARRDGDHIANA
jgi:hypothetical protein